MLLSLLVGSLGLEAVIAAEWIRASRLHQEQQLAEEEESLTPYNSKDSAEKPDAQTTDQVRSGFTTKVRGWEFKIVRANRAIFHNPQVFQHLCDEEAQAGWVLVEKFDDQRVRFKRPIAFREMIQSESLPFDPYRTQYGPSGLLSSSLVTIIVFLVVTLLPAYLGYQLVTITLTSTRSGGYPQSTPQIQPSIQPTQVVPTPKS